MDIGSYYTKMEKDLEHVGYLPMVAKSIIGSANVPREGFCRGIDAVAQSIIVQPTASASAASHLDSATLGIVFV